MGRYEIADGAGNGAIVDATETALSADVFFDYGQKIESSMLSLELYGMIGKEPADDDVPLKCEDGDLFETGLTSFVIIDNKKAYFTLDLNQVTDKVSDGNNIKVCASLLTTPLTGGQEAARLETIFDITYTYESGEFDFSVSIEDPAAAELTDSSAFAVDVEAFVCDTNNQKLSNNLADDAAEARIGQG